MAGLEHKVNDAQVAAFLVDRAKNDGWHLRHGLEGERTWNRIVPKSGDLEQAKLVNNWGRLKLADAQASELRLELNELLGRYLELSEEGKPHLLHPGLVEEAP